MVQLWLVPRIPLIESPVLPLINVQELRLVHSGFPIGSHPSSFHALEKFTIERDTNLSHLFSAWFSNPSVSPLMKLSNLGIVPSPKSLWWNLHGPLPTASDYIVLRSPIKMESFRPLIRFGGFGNMCRLLMR